MRQYCTVVAQHTGQEATYDQTHPLIALLAHGTMLSAILMAQDCTNWGDTKNTVFMATEEHSLKSERFGGFDYILLAPLRS